MEKNPGTGPLRKSLRHARQRFDEESSSESSESEHSDPQNGSRDDDDDDASSSSSDMDSVSKLPDPSNPLYKQPKYESGLLMASKSKRGRLARPMHEGDDEGRAPAKRVRRPPPQATENDDDNDAGESTAARGHDDEGDEDDEEDEYNDDDDDENDNEENSDDAVSLGASDSYSSCGSLGGTTSRHPRGRRGGATKGGAPGAVTKKAPQRKSQRVVSQQQHPPPHAPPPPHRQGDEEDGSTQHAGRPPRAAQCASAGPPRVKLSRCWLCTFANCKMAKRISEFVSASAGTMDPAIMADQIKGEVKREYPHASGIGRHSVLRHLREHVLLPNVRMASIVRSLIALAETLRCTLHHIDEETNEVMVDIRNTELYLKVIAQIHSVYRTDGGRMMFGTAGALAAAPNSAASGSGTSPAAPAGPSK